MSNNEINTKDANTKEQNFRKKHILIVDDEEGIRVMLETKLYQCGYNVSVAGGGMHAMQKIRSGKVIDLIICDLKMPGMSGGEFFKQVQAEWPQIPFLLITGFPERDRILEAVRLGVKDVVLKPVKHNDLMGKIKVYLGESTTVEAA